MIIKEMNPKITDFILINFLAILEYLNGNIPEYNAIHVFLDGQNRFLVQQLDNHNQWLSKTPRLKSDSSTQRMQPVPVVASGAASFTLTTAPTEAHDGSIESP